MARLGSPALVVMHGAGLLVGHHDGALFVAGHQRMRLLNLALLTQRFCFRKPQPLDILCDYG